jgi:hypothetical protein
MSAALYCCAGLHGKPPAAQQLQLQLPAFVSFDHQIQQKLVPGFQLLSCQCGYRARA